MRTSTKRRIGGGRRNRSNFLVSCFVVAAVNKKSQPKQSKRDTNREPKEAIRNLRWPMVWDGAVGGGYIGQWWNIIIHPPYVGTNEKDRKEKHRGTIIKWLYEPKTDWFEFWSDQNRGMLDYYLCVHFQNKFILITHTSHFDVDGELIAAVVKSSQVKSDEEWRVKSEEQEQQVASCKR